SSLRIHTRLGDVLDTAVDLCRFASVLARQGKAGTAARLVAIFESLGEEVGIRRSGVAAMNETTLATVRTQLDDAAVAEAWQQGRKLTVGEAVALALDSETNWGLYDLEGGNYRSPANFWPVRRSTLTVAAALAALSRSRPPLRRTTRRSRASRSRCVSTVSTAGRSTPFRGRRLCVPSARSSAGTGSPSTGSRDREHAPHWARADAPLFGARIIRRGVRGYDVGVLQLLVRRRGLRAGAAERGC